MSYDTKKAQSRKRARAWESLESFVARGNAAQGAVDKILAKKTLPAFHDSRRRSPGAGAQRQGSPRRPKTVREDARPTGRGLRMERGGA
jgi:hypothetical protein